MSDLGAVKETEAGFTVKQFISQPINLNCKSTLAVFLLFVFVCLMKAMRCSAGTIQRDYFDNTYSIRFVDGNCQIHTLTKDDFDFNAAIVCFGLFGIATEISYQCVDNYFIQGSQVSLTLNTWKKSGDTQTADGIGTFDILQKKMMMKTLYII